MLRAEVILLSIVEFILTKEGSLTCTLLVYWAFIVAN